MIRNRQDKAESLHFYSLTKEGGVNKRIMALLVTLVLAWVWNMQTGRIFFQILNSCYMFLKHGLLK
jgi:hypothetical protein